MYEFVEEFVFFHQCCSATTEVLKKGPSKQRPLRGLHQSSEQVFKNESGFKQVSNSDTHVSRGFLAIKPGAKVTFESYIENRDFLEICITVVTCYHPCEREEILYRIIGKSEQ